MEPPAAPGTPQPPDGAGSSESPTWDDIQLIHVSLPEIDLDEVDCSLTFLGHRLRLPLLIDATAAGPFAAVLARAAQRFGAACIAGISEGAAFSGGASTPAGTAPDRPENAFLIAGLAVSRLAGPPDGPRPRVDEVEAAVRAMGAQALLIELDFLAEVERAGDGARAEGCAQAIGDLARGLSVPVIVREQGGGMTVEAAAQLKAAGVAALDPGGRDSTQAVSAAIEPFRTWGLPPAIAVANAAATGLPVIAGSGVRHGLDAAKAIATGAMAVCIGLPVVEAARESEAAVNAALEQFEAELHAAMFLTGSRTLADLRQQRTVILGATLEWLRP
jgi:isopentenyl-diphosphate delta-isomerase